MGQLSNGQGEGRKSKLTGIRSETLIDKEVASSPPAGLSRRSGSSEKAEETTKTAIKWREVLSNG